MFKEILVNLVSSLVERKTATQVVVFTGIVNLTRDFKQFKPVHGCMACGQIPPVTPTSRPWAIF